LLRCGPLAPKKAAFHCQCPLRGSCSGRQQKAVNVEVKAAISEMLRASKEYWDFKLDVALSAQRISNVKREHGVGRPIKKVESRSVYVSVFLAPSLRAAGKTETNSV